MYSTWRQTKAIFLADSGIRVAREEITLTRKELYDQVWSEPMRTLARKYALSDVGLAKICKKHNIPRPSRGWWAQQQAGYKVQRIPLPKGKEDEKIRITVDHERASHRGHLRGIVATTRKKKVALEKLLVPDTLIDPHPLVATSSEALAAITPAANGLVPPPRYCLDVCVSSEARARALLIMDTLIKALEVKGYVVHLAQGSTVVIVHDVNIPIATNEGLKPERLRARDHDLEGDYEFGYNKHSMSIPSGQLSLRVVGFDDYPSSALRRLWRDTETHRLEEILYTVIPGLEKTAAAERARKEKLEGKHGPGPDV